MVEQSPDSTVEAADSTGVEGSTVVAADSTEVEGSTVVVAAIADPVGTSRALFSESAFCFGRGLFGCPIQASFAWVDSDFPRPIRDVVAFRASRLCVLFWTCSDYFHWV
jgi:hypothetical protein